MKNKIITIAAMLAIVMAMTGLAAASGAFSTSPVDIDPSLTSSIPIDVQFWNDNPFAPTSARISVFEDTDNDGLFNSLIDLPSTALNVRWNSTLSFATPPLDVNPTVWSLSEIGITIGSSSNQNRYSNTINVQNNGVTAGKTYFILTTTPSGTITISNLIAKSEGHAIPEFPTVALPIAAVIGLVFLFQQKKKKQE